MVTRLYPLTDSYGVPTITPAAGAGWGDTNDMVRRHLQITIPPADIYRTDGTLIGGNRRAEDRTGTEVSASAIDCLMFQFISPPLSGAQTISGTIKGQARCAESVLTAGDLRSQLGVLVVSGDGATLRGTALAPSASALSSEWRVGALGGGSNQHDNRKFPLAADSPATLTNVNASDGDRLVVEMGFRSHDISASSNQGAIWLDPDAGSDLAENETSGSAIGRPWVEFSGTFTFADPQVRTTHIHLEAAISAADPHVRITNVIAEAAIEEFWHGWDIQLQDGDWGGTPPEQPGARGKLYRNSGNYRDPTGYRIA